MNARFSAARVATTGARISGVRVVWLIMNGEIVRTVGWAVKESHLCIFRAKSPADCALLVGHDVLVSAR